MALGDSSSAGEGVQPFDMNSDYNYQGMTDTCHRSTSGAYSRMVKLPGHTNSIDTESKTLGQHGLLHHRLLGGNNDRYHPEL